MKLKSLIFHVIGFGIAVGSVFLTFAFLICIALFGTIILAEPNHPLLYFEIGVYAFGTLYAATCVYKCRLPKATDEKVKN